MQEADARKAMWDRQLTHEAQLRDRNQRIVSGPAIHSTAPLITLFILLDDLMHVCLSKLPMGVNDIQ